MSPIMKVKISKAGLLALLIPLFTYAKDQKYVTTGSIGKISYSFIDDYIDSDGIKNGYFKFSGMFDEAKPVLLMINSRETGSLSDLVDGTLYTLYFHVEPGATKVINPGSVYNVQISNCVVDTNNNRLKALIDLTWSQVSNPKGFKNRAAPFDGVRRVPTGFIASPGGKVIGMNLFGAEQKKELKELFKE